MSSHSLTHLSLVFLLVYADIAYSKVHYITPSPDGPCPQNSSCLTLSQFATDLRSIETDISLLLIPGNHTLDRELSLTQANNFSMTKDGLDSERVFVKCSTHSGRFNISDTIFVSVKDLHFIGCGSNSVSRVKWLTITGSTFQDVHDVRTVLLLNEISNANIVKSFFLSNLLHFPTPIARYYSNSEMLNYVYLQRSTPSGVIHTVFSNISVISSKFMDNRADIGGALVAHNSSLYLARSTYSNNTANLGGVMVTSGSTIFIDRNAFINNTSRYNGGVMITYNDIFTISSTTYTNNFAFHYHGGVMITFGNSSFDISNSIFTKNSADTRGGVMDTDGSSSFNISNSSFTKNSAGSGGVMCTWSGGSSSFNISNSIFTNNNAAYGGGVIRTVGNVWFNISNSIFTNNSADAKGGVIFTYYGSSFDITNSSFTKNSAAAEGGVMYTDGNSFFDISNSIFTTNRAVRSGSGGVMYIESSASFNIFTSIFVNNRATVNGGIIWCSKHGTLKVDNSNFSLNGVFNQGGGVIFILQCSAHISNSIFDKNNGSLYSFNSNLTVSGYLKFKHTALPLIARNVIESYEGGAITSFQSIIIFTRKSTVHISNNRASHGGAILATESTITIYGETIIVNNMANCSGGGISLTQSRLEIKGKCQIVNNNAMRGGGIHAYSSTIAVYQPGILQVTNNSADFGGGIYLKASSKLYILRNEVFYMNYFMNFTGNHANYGGAAYVDDSNSGGCLPNVECFIQVLALSHSYVFNSIENVFFSENAASEQGPNIFGGLLDRCIPSPFAEVYLKQRNYSGHGIIYLQDNTNTNLLDSISSQPVRLCFCNSEHEPDCSYQPSTIRVQKGKPINVSLVAVDQVNYTINANVSSFLSSPVGGFGEGQQTQSVERNCTNLTFNVFSPHDSEILNLYPNGPCGSATLSTSSVTIQFIACTCPVGFEPLSNSKSSTKCECVCDSALSPYITKCNFTTSLVLRKGTNSWITFNNGTDPHEYVIYRNCPFDYCQPQVDNISINFNLLNGADSQCAHNRTGVLCGACKENLSLSLASSHCVRCHTHWHAVFVVILLAAAIAGILLVTALLALNMTVSVGLINGFIFYANIVSAGSAIFIPSSEPSFPSTFVAWLNLDVGVDVCFFDGLDAYTKSWIQLVFPVYIISLVYVVIILSKHFSRFARLIGKKDPISTLATLIMLSYAKLLSITITALSSAVLDYPDGKQETVWLPDGHLKYFRGKHIPLALMALLIIIIGLPYTIILFLYMWQWIIRAPLRWKVFNWTRNTKLIAFISSHHIPHNSKYRYWTGLLLLVRVILYITASVTVSASPQTFPLITGILVGGLIILKATFGLRVYKKSFVNIVETVLHFNLLLLALFSLYDFKVNVSKQTAAVYTSTIITFVLLIGAIIYHVTLLVVKEKKPEELIEDILVTVKPTKVTHSVVELPKHNDKQADDNQVGQAEYRLMETPTYVEYQ